MRRLTCLLIAVAAALCAPARSRGADDEKFREPIGLADLIAYARQNNPEIRAAQEKWRAAQARPSQAGSLPDPMVDLAYHNEGFDRLNLGDTDFAFVRVGASQE